MNEGGDFLFQNIIEKVVHFDHNAFRNIPTIIKSEDLLDDLSTSANDWKYGEALVSESGPEDLSPIISRPFHYGVATGDMRQVSRFSDGSRFGVWYGSLTDRTTVYETVYHWQRRFMAVSKHAELKDELRAHRRVFRVHAQGLLVDLVGREKKEPLLIHKSDYSFTHALGRYLRGQGANGLLFRSARDGEGVNVGLFNPKVLSDVRHSCYLRYRWTPGEKIVRVEKTLGKTWKTIPSFF